MKGCNFREIYISGWKDNILKISILKFSSVTQLCPTLCDPHGLQHARLPCPSPTPRACSNSCPQVSNAIQLSHPQSSSSPPALPI